MADLTLSPLAAQLLKIIVDHTTIGGSGLMRAAGLKSPEDLLAPVQELQSKNLIQASGDTSSANTVPFAYFGTPPSAKEYIYSVLKQQSA